MKTLILCLLVAVAPAFAAGKEKEAAPVGYGGAKVQLQPIMTPYHTAGAGVRYEVLTLRVVIDTGPKERPACFAIPLIHDRIVAYLYGANLTAADFIGQRREVLAKNLFDVAINTTGQFAPLTLQATRWRVWLPRVMSQPKRN